MISNISHTGRQALGAKAKAQKATGAAGKFGHLQHDAPRTGLKPDAPSLYEAYGIDPAATHRYADFLARVDAIHQASKAIRAVYPDAASIVLEMPSSGEEQWTIREVAGAGGAAVLRSDALDDLRIPGSPDTVQEVFWNLPLVDPQLTPEMFTGFSFAPAGEVCAHINLEAASRTPKLETHILAGLPVVPQRKPDHNAYSGLHTRTEVGAAHERMMEAIQETDGTLGNRHEFEGYYRSRMADFDAVDPQPSPGLAALKEKLKADREAAIEGRDRARYLETVRDDTGARVKLQELHQRFPTATTLYLQAGDQGLGLGNWDAAWLVDAEGVRLHEDGGPDAVANEMFIGLSERYGEQSWSGMGHLARDVSNDIRRISIADAHQPQPAFLANPSLITAPRVPSASGNFLSNCNTVEHLGFRYSQIQDGKEDQYARDIYAARLAELRAAGL